MSSELGTQVGAARGCALITGAGSGIGHASAQWFATRGWLVVAVDIDTRHVPSGAIPVRGDVSAPGVIESAVEAAENECGALSVLVNNAVHRDDGDVLSCRQEDWDHAFEVHVTAAMRGIRRALPRMLERGCGCIVNVSSVAGLHGLRGRVAYSASKGALIALSRQVALDYGDRGIRSVCVCPGATLTEGVRQRLAARQDAPGFTNRYAAQQTVGRLLRPEEVAETIGLVAAEGPATALNGAVLTLDGGSHLRTPSDSSTIVEPATAANGQPPSAVSLSVCDPWRSE